MRDTARSNARTIGQRRDLPASEPSGAGCVTRRATAVDEAREITLQRRAIEYSRTCDCPDPLDVREEGARLECGRCAMPIYPNPMARLLRGTRPPVNGYLEKMVAARAHVGSTPARAKSEKAVLMNLATHSNAANEAWPTIETIALETGLSEPTVKRAIRGLIAVGVIERRARTRDDGGTGSNLYRLRLGEGVTMTPPITMTPGGGHHDPHRGSPRSPGGGHGDTGGGGHHDPRSNQREVIREVITESESARPAEVEKPKAQTIAPSPSNNYAVPDTIVIDADLLSWAATAGVPTPTPEHVQAFLLHARATGRIHSDWLSGFKFWMTREKVFAQRRGPRVAIVQPVPPTGPAWTVGNRATR